MAVPPGGSAKGPVQAPACGWDATNTTPVPIAVTSDGEVKVSGTVQAITSPQQNEFQIVKNNETIAAGASCTSNPDDCSAYPYWGFSLYTEGTGDITVEYSIDGSLWRTLETISNVSGNENRIYRVTRRYYRVTYTNTSGSDHNIDLVTIRSP